MSEPKEQLKRIRLIDSMLKSLNDSYNSMGSVKAIVYDKDRVQTSPNADAMTDMMIRIEEIECDILKLTLERTDTILLINKLTKPEYIDILNMRYVDGMKWNVIISKFKKKYGPYDDRQIYRIHGDALKAFSKIMSVNVSN